MSCDFCFMELRCKGDGKASDTGGDDEDDDQEDLPEIEKRGKKKEEGKEGGIWWRTGTFLY